MAPTKEEEIKLKDYNGDISKLGSAERFLKGILDIPFAFKRVEAMLYRANFDGEVKYLRKSFETLEVQLWRILQIQFQVYCHLRRTNLQNCCLEFNQSTSFLSFW